METMYCQSVVKEYAGENLFTIQHLGLQRGQIVGLVGNNGAGKSTFLNIISGQDTDFVGKMEVRTDCAYVSQLKEESQLSGGEQVVQALAQAFATKAGLLLLDEPTANLDSPNTNWLIQQLRRFRGAAFIVSHDRAFLNQIADQIWHLDAGTITVYRGNYDDFLEERKHQRELQAQEYEGYRNKLHQLQAEKERRLQKAQKMTKKKKTVSASDWKVNARLGAYDGKEKAMAKSAKHLDKRMQQLEKVEQPRKDAWFKLEAKGALLQDLHSLFRLQAGELWLENRLLFRFPDLSMRYGDKLAILGANGTGKTSLVRALLAQSLAGFYHPKLQPAYFAQNLQNLIQEKTVLDNVMATSVQDRVTVLNLLGMMGIGFEKAKRTISSLSGGERVRVSLAKVLLSDTNLLILDEPTNFLDLATLDALELFLKSYQGSVLLISHDQWLVDRVCRRKWLIEDKILQEI